MRAETMPLAGAGSIHICRANWRDVRQLYRLEKRCFPIDSWPLLDIVLALILPNMKRFKAVEGQRMIGFVMGESRGGMGWISTFGVDPDYRRQGVGTMLLNTCETALGHQTVRLSVRTSNDSAIRLYRKQGYETVGSWPRYYKGGEDALVMEKSAGIPSGNPLPD